LTTRNSTTRKSSSIRLTDMQLIVMSRAVQREDGAATLPEGMPEKAAQKLAATLVQKALVREIRAKPGMPVWRRNEEGRSHALVITKLGRTAIKVEDDHQPEDVDVGAHGSASTDEAAPAQSERSTPRQGSKLSTVIDLLGREKGAGIEELMAATGWLPHTTRAALTGLRKRGYAIQRARSEKGGSVYRMVTGPAAGALAA
ncbi:MAG: DUF3489 domain-containing protein, partial [Gemmatimonadota bacterium]|nr:DUF3489 domain-containing protein [Gemmatimonadota bacterium]